MALFSSTLVGVKPLPVEIEIDLSDGLPFFQIVGLPDTVLRESKTRVKSAIIQAGFKFPYDQRVVLNLAPSKIRKEGSSLELAMAARILSSTGQIQVPSKSGFLFLGELALDGAVRGVPEIEALSFAALQDERIKCIAVAAEMQDAVRRRAACPVIGISHLNDFRKPEWWESEESANIGIERSRKPQVVGKEKSFDLNSLHFSKFWQKHLELAVVGGHSYLLSGPPGCGKTFFAESLRLFVGALARDVAADPEQMALNALFGREDCDVPWAAPHHCVTSVGLLGGGTPPKPGAVTRAHGGVLFLDELLEFHPSVLDSLREPLERGFVEIYRAGLDVTFPSKVQVISATNPCRCGNDEHPVKPCLCSAYSKTIYQSRISGPFFDRFDIRVKCPVPEGNEERVRGKEILNRIKAAIEFKEKLGGEIPWKSSASQWIDAELGYKIPNHRSLEKLKRISQSLAALSQKDQVDQTCVDEALRLQSFQRVKPNRH